MSTGMRRLITTLPPPMNGRRAYLVPELASEMKSPRAPSTGGIQRGLLKGEKRLGYTVIPAGEVTRFLGQESRG